MMEEYNHHIFFRFHPLPITKISYVANPNKEATMKITRGDNPVNLIVHPKFRLRTSLRAKFQWVITQSNKLGLSLPPALATFEMTAEDKKRKKSEFLKEVFTTENITIFGMHRNLIPPEVMLIEGLVINEPESGIFFMNETTHITFQREMDSKVMKGLSEFKALESNIRRIRVKDVIKEVKNYLKTYSSAGMDIS
nr:hypothetical protein [Tanacetum cinerariifolium]